MPDTLFLHSDNPNPFPLYQQRLTSNPVYWDHEQQCWAVYSYTHCKTLLTHPAALIPTLPDTGLSPDILRIRRQLVRLSNPPEHHAVRSTTANLFLQLRPIAIGPLLDSILAPQINAAAMDWVDCVCRTLPVRYILAGFGFDAKDQDLILEHMPIVLKIMQPALTPDQATALRHSCTKVLACLERHFTASADATADATTSSASADATTSSASPTTSSASLLGLLIQSYDGGSGLLANALLRLLHTESPLILQDASFYQKFVTEILRHDPPVHHTRRIAGEDITLNGHILKKRQLILIVLAAANRDEQHFADPTAFNIHRNNNHDLLTFGYGLHSCLAATFSVRLAAETLFHLVHSYMEIRLLEKEIKYEALANVRLLQRLSISLRPKNS